VCSLLSGEARFLCEFQHGPRREGSAAERPNRLPKNLPDGNWGVAATTAGLGKEGARRRPVNLFIKKKGK